MGIIRAITSATSGTLADQWKDIIVPEAFTEHMVMVPGIIQETNNGRGSNTSFSDGVITNGSKIFVPENTVAVIFDSGKIEQFITTPGSYEYYDGEKSIFNGDKVKDTLMSQISDRVGFGGQPSTQKKVSFINLREIRGIKFGTHGALMYNDLFYGTDLSIMSYGTISLQVVDSKRFIQNFIPANITRYTFDDSKARSQILAEFLQSYMVTMNSMSSKYRISQLPAQSNEISKSVAGDVDNAGTWPERFGFKLVRVAIENIEFSPESHELVKQFSSRKMNVKAYDNVSKKSADIAAQQKISQGIQNNGLGEGGGMLYGMNMAQNLGPNAESKSTLSINDQIETLKKLKGLLDAGILSQEEFDIKKKEIMGM